MMDCPIYMDFNNKVRPKITAWGNVLIVVQLMNRRNEYGLEEVTHPLDSRELRELADYLDSIKKNNKLGLQSSEKAGLCLTDKEVMKNDIL